MNKKTVKIRAVLCGALLTGASTGIFSNSIAVFITPVCADLGLQRGSFTLISSITLLFSMAVLPLFAKFLPKADLRILTALSSLVCSGSILIYSFCRGIWHFYFAAALYGLFVNGITLLTAGMLLRRLDIKVSGAVSGAAFAAAGIFSFVFMPLLQRVVSAYGWRWGYRLQSAAGAVVLLAALLIMPKADAKPLGANRSPSFMPLFKKRGMLLTASALFIANAVNLALFNHSAAILIGIGLSAAAAASVTSWAALFSSASKPIFGISLDKFGLKTGAVILSASLLGASFSALLLPSSRLALFTFPILLSFCACSNSIPANVFAARLFDEADFAAAASALTLASTAGSAVGPPLAGLVFDRFGSYLYMWYGCAAASAIVCFLLISAISRACLRK